MLPKQPECFKSDYDRVSVSTKEKNPQINSQIGLPTMNREIYPVPGNFKLELSMNRRMSQNS